MNALLALRPAKPLGVQLRASMPVPCQRRLPEGLPLHHPFQNRTIPRLALNLPPLSKVRCCRPKKFERLPEGLSLHHPFQNRTITLAFRTAIVCVCLYGFAFKLSHLAFRRARVCVCLYGFASVQNLGHTR